jgi:hypothetical protein
VRHNDAVVREGQARGEVDPVREHSHLVGASVAVGVLEDLDAVVSRLAVEDAVRIVGGFDEPQPAVLVERERNRLADHRLAGEQLEPELGRELDELHRVRRRERHLVLRRRIPLLVVGHVEAVDVLDVGHLQRLPRRPRLLVHGPHRGPLDQRLEPGISPRALVVTEGGVEHAAAVLGPHPGIRLASVRVHAIHEHGTALRVVPRVDVCLVPRLERLEPAHDRVVRPDDLRREFAGAVARELPADQRRVARRPGEHRRGGVDRHQALAALDELDERLLFGRRHRLVVGVDHQRVVMPERRGVECLGRRHHMRELDALARERPRQHRHQPD